MQRRDVVALLGALLFTLFLIVLLYLFFNGLWPVLPAWISVPVCILVAVLAIGSPIFTLRRISDRLLQDPQRRVKTPARPRE